MPPRRTMKLHAWGHENLLCLVDDMALRGSGGVPAELLAPVDCARCGAGLDAATTSNCDGVELRVCACGFRQPTHVVAEGSAHAAVGLAVMALARAMRGARPAPPANPPVDARVAPDPARVAAAPPPVRGATIRERVLSALRAAGGDGLTTEELAGRLPRDSHSSVRTRVSELERSGEVRSTDRRRATSHGGTATVYVADR